tara:strand:+ start:279 stop:431 length:153 start_codon:yes stop_codon:yes gene_type:complete
MHNLNGKKENTLWQFFKKLFREVYKVLYKIEHSLLVIDYPNGKSDPFLEL